MLSRLAATIAMVLVCGGDVRAAPAFGSLPEDLAVAPLLQRLRINGIELAISAMSSAVAPERSCARIAQRWARARGIVPGPCQRRGEWWLISRRAGMHEQTAQLQSTNNGSAGFLSELDLAAPPMALPAPLLALPAGARVLNVVQSAGQGDAMAQFTVALPQPPSVAVRQLIASALARGWQIAPTSRGALLDLKRGSVEIRAIVDAAVIGEAGERSSVVMIERHGPERRP